MLPHRIWVLAILPSLCVHATDLAWLIQLSPVAKANTERQVCPINPGNCCCPEVCRRQKRIGSKIPCHQKEASGGKLETHGNSGKVRCSLWAGCKDKNDFLDTASLATGILPDRLSLFVNEGEASLRLARGRTYPLEGYPDPLFHPPSYPLFHPRFFQPISYSS